MSHHDPIAIGQTAPDFTAKTSQHKVAHLAEHRNKENVVLVFYPGDNTPLCTAQLCGFRDNYAAVLSYGAIVYGVNPASAEKHAKFAEKHEYPFPLIEDEGGKIAAAYGCKGFLGLMIKRTVYLIDKEGKIRYAERGDPPVSEVLAVLKGL